ncbi:DUF1572 family protein [Algoriphagus confluentis]|uniref:DUF1572 domain-containing protein n=1 Tax=Algoriphagus confluentis TaxID=1697556 RepID=A0ABQ6PIR4_9BACT|nr:hypothetical protein Aconfl_02300 [Algoriphagus confluentis]
METKDINLLFQRDLDRLKKEVEAYQMEEDLWVIVPGTSNSGGNLTLHLLGNLRAFIGSDMGKTPYQRDREREFGAKNIPRIELLEEIDLVKGIMDRSLTNLNPQELEKISPHRFFGYEMTQGYFLVHLYGHFNYHLGQINYHRRMINS